MNNIIATVGFAIDTSSLQALEQRLNQLDREFDTLGKSAKDAFNSNTLRSFDRAEKSMDDVGDKAKEAGDKTKDATTKVDGFRRALGAIDNLTGGFLGGILAGIDEVRDAFTELNEVYNDFGGVGSSDSGSGAAAANAAAIAAASRSAKDANDELARSNAQVAQTNGAAAMSAVAAAAGIASYAKDSQTAAAVVDLQSRAFQTYSQELDRTKARLEILQATTGKFGQTGLAGRLVEQDNQRVSQLNGLLRNLGPNAAGAAGGVTALGGAAALSAPVLAALAVAAIAVVGAIAGLAVSFSNLNAIQGINDLSDATGIAAENLSAFAEVARQEDISIGELGNLFNRMSRAINDAVESNSKLAETFTKLGLSTRELQALSPEERFIRIFDAIQNVNDVGQRYEAVVEIFGRSGVQILRAAESGEELRRKLEEVKKSGGAASKELLDLANQQEEQLKELSSEWQILKNNITAIFAPAIISGLETLNGLIDGQADAWLKVAPAISPTLGLLAQYVVLTNKLRAQRQGPYVPPQILRDAVGNGPGSELTAGDIAGLSQFLPQTTPAPIDNTTDAEKAAAAERARIAAEQEAERQRQRAAQEAEKAAREATIKQQREQAELEKKRREEQERINAATELRADFERELKILTEAQAQIASGVIDTQQEYNTFLSQEREIQSIILSIKRQGLDITEEEIRARVAAIRQLQQANDEEVERAEERKRQEQQKIDELNEYIEDTIGSIGDLLSDSIIEGLETGKFSFKQFLYDLGKLLLSSSIKKIFASLFEVDINTGGGSSGGGWLNILGSIFTSFFTRGASTTGVTTINTGANYAGYAKNGGIFDQDGAKFFANGGIINKRTMFNYAGGTGIMGEAGGPEAIIPLAKTTDGKLGVRAMGGGAATSIQNFKMAENITIQVQSTDNAQRDDAETAKALDRMLNIKFKQFIQEQQRPGNMLSPKLAQ